MKNLIFFFVIFFIGCSSETNTEDLFTENEQTEIDKLVADFDTLIMKYTQSRSVSRAYIAFAEKQNNAPTYEAYLDFLNKIIEDVDILIENHRNDSIFDKIWYTAYGFKSREKKDTLSVGLTLKLPGIYSQFPGKTANKNEFIGMYKADLDDVNDLAPKMVDAFPYYIQDFNLKDKYQRFCIAVHYITVMSRKKY
ncbi:MAG TPA: hypothetical protein P5514_01340 [Bacteroidales bacterium]|nr:hypothetical protein [Bacteroidales bacterium]HRX95560.1 hypothetical protein [Bacteroidales bacterium]